MRATIIDVMEWMINTQLGRRNLPPAQRISVVDKFKKKIQEQAKENMSIGGSSDKKGYPNGETLIQKQTHTDKELAKMSGVGTGTVARYDAIMKTDVLTYLNPTFVVEAKSVDQQRKLENVLKNWKDYMGSSMVGIENQVQIILT